MNTKSKGNKAEGVIIAEFIKRGYPVSLPFGDNEPYDMIADFDGTLKKIQIKHGKTSNGCVVADIRKRIGSKRIKYESYYDKVDYIAIWCEELDKVYIISGDMLKKTTITLRYQKPKNNLCISTILWAKDFVIDSALI